MKFEEKLAKLESLVAGMESGKLNIDEMISAFEEGRKLVEDCTADLNAIKLKIEKITASGTEPLDVTKE